MHDPQGVDQDDKTSFALHTLRGGSDIGQVRHILDRVGDKWSLLVIALLGRGMRRFTELPREIDDISQRMLTLTLRQLERDGLVERTVYPVVPPRVEYCLTALGATLLDTVHELVRWTLRHRGTIAAARSRMTPARQRRCRQQTSKCCRPGGQARGIMQTRGSIP